MKTTNNAKVIGLVFGYCAIGVLLAGLAPLLDSAQSGRLWLIGLALLPVVPPAGVVGLRRAVRRASR